MSTAEDTRSVLALAQYLGYKPKVTAPAVNNTICLSISTINR